METTQAQTRKTRTDRAGAGTITGCVSSIALVALGAILPYPAGVTLFVAGLAVLAITAHVTR